MNINYIILLICILIGIVLTFLLYLRDSQIKKSRNNVIYFFYFFIMFICFYFMITLKLEATEINNFNLQTQLKPHERLVEYENERLVAYDLEENFYFDFITTVEVSAGAGFGGWPGLVTALLINLGNYGVFVCKQSQLIKDNLQDSKRHFQLVESYSEKKRSLAT